MKNIVKSCFAFWLLFAVANGSFAQSRVQRWDDATLEYLARHRTPGQTRLWQFVANSNTYVDIGVPAGLLVAGVIRDDPDMRQNALYVASSVASTAIVNALLKKLIKRPRPFITNIHLTPVYRPTSWSFPSGHSSSAFSCMTSLSRAYPKWYVIAPSMLWAGAIGYSRMYLGVHYPSDVLAGAALGTGSAFAWGFLRR